MKKEKADELDFEGEEKPTKKPYHAPKLTVHGTVEQITRYLGLSGADVPFGNGSLP